MGKNKNKLNVTKKQVEAAKDGLTETKKKLFEAKKENTKIISRITNFGELQMKLNKKLDSTNKQLFVF